MKKIRTILSVLLITVMMMAVMSIAALAEPAATDYQIIIDNAVDGEKYTAYKVFDVTYANPDADWTSPDPVTVIPGPADGTSAHTAYAYTINSSTNAWWSVVTTEGENSMVPATVNVGTFFTANGLKFTKNTVDNEWNVEAVTTGANRFDAAAFAVLLNSNTEGKTKAAEVTAGPSTYVGSTTNYPSDDDIYYTTGKIILNVGLSGAGYYFVDTTVGALCSLDTTENTATIREKNSLPTQTKTVSDAADGTYGASTSASIGDTVYFKIDVTDGTGTNKSITVHDEMSAGLTLVTNSFTVQANTGTDGALVTVPETNNYTITTSGLEDGCTFEIVFSDSFIAGLDTGKVITVKYTATLNADAEIAGTAGNPNTSWIEYSNHNSPEVTATVYTYAGAIYKVDGTQTSGTAAPELAGATFAVTIESDQTSTEGTTTHTSTPVKLTQMQAGSATAPAVYKYTPGSDDAGNTIVTPESGAVVLIGFKEDLTLTLTETVAPTGYNLLAAPVTLTINAQHANTGDKTATTDGGLGATFVATTYDEEDPTVVVESGDDAEYQINGGSINIIQNKTGTELPSTGGIGTTIFYVVGALLVISAAVVLVLKKRSGRDA